MRVSTCITPPPPASREVVSAPRGARVPSGEMRAMAMPLPFDGTGARWCPDADTVRPGAWEILAGSPEDA